MKIKQNIIGMVGLVAALTFGSVIYAQHFSDWAAPINASEVNSPQGDGCAMESRDGLTLFLSSDRPGGLGGLDIWVARRASEDDRWEEPQNLGAPVNTSGDDYCPAPVGGHGLYFISSYPYPGSCGGPDIYFTRAKHGEWEQPENLGCEINGPAAEWRPSYFEGDDGQAYLYFSSTRPGGFDDDPGPTGDMDIYFSVRFGVPQLAPGLNTAFTDARPNVRKDGLEIVFDTNRPGSLGINDIWTATRESVDDEWSSPVHLPAPINSAVQEASPSLSWDGTRMYFNFGASSQTADILMTTRPKLKGNER